MRNNEKLQTEQQQQTKSNAINFDKMYFWKSFGRQINKLSKDKFTMTANQSNAAFFVLSNTHILPYALLC